MLHHCYCRRPTLSLSWLVFCCSRKHRVANLGFFRCFCGKSETIGQNEFRTFNKSSFSAKKKCGRHSNKQTTNTRTNEQTSEQPKQQKHKTKQWNRAFWRSETKPMPINNKLEAGGKPSTWFPPGELVELLTPKMCHNASILQKYKFKIVFYKSHHIIVLISTCFRNSVFQISNSVFQPYELFKTRNRYHLISRSLHLCFWSILRFLKNFDCFHVSSFLGSESCAFWIFRFF